MNIMVLGMPNVGKSTLLNSFRCIGMLSKNTGRKTRINSCLYSKGNNLYSLFQGKLQRLAHNLVLQKK